MAAKYIVCSSSWAGILYSASIYIYIYTYVYIYVSGSSTHGRCRRVTPNIHIVAYVCASLLFVLQMRISEASFFFFKVYKITNPTIKPVCVCFFCVNIIYNNNNAYVYVFHCLREYNSTFEQMIAGCLPQRGGFALT